MARIATLFVFQRVVVEEYMKTIIPSDIYDHYFSGRPRSAVNFFLKDIFKQGQRVPLEFSHAAFRFGHCMVRNRYVMVDNGEQVELTKLFKRSQRLDKQDQISWKKFFSDANGEFSGNDANSIGLHIAEQLEIVNATNDSKKNEQKVHCRFKDKKNLEENPSSVDQQFWKNIVVEDIEASAALPVAKDIWTAIDRADENFDFLKNLKPNDYQRVTRFDTKRIVKKGWSNIYIQRISPFGSKPETLDWKNAPLWLFVLREAEEYPVDSNTKKFKLGPLGAIIISEVISNSIWSSQQNIWNDFAVQNWKGEFGDCYQSLIADGFCMQKIIKLLILEEEKLL